MFETLGCPQVTQHFFAAMGASNLLKNKNQLSPPLRFSCNPMIPGPGELKSNTQYHEICDKIASIDNAALEYITFSNQIVDLPQVRDD